MKSIWKGSISFGLVSIPIQLFSAIQEHILGFKLLCEKCNTPVEYQKWCSQCKKKLEWPEVVKGLPVSKGKYIVLTQEKIKELRPEKTNTIDIQEFVNSWSIDAIYYDNHYYAAPIEGDKAKAFVLLRTALDQMKKTAIGKFVMRDKEYVVALQPFQQGILLSTLNYAYEIRSMDKIAQLASKKVKVTASELKLAKELIGKLTVKKFNISQFKDTFAQQLMDLIKHPKKAKKIKKAKKVTETTKRVPTLEDTLMESLHEARA